MTCLFLSVSVFCSLALYDGCSFTYSLHNSLYITTQSKPLYFTPLLSPPYTHPSFCIVAMDSSKLSSLFLICILFISTTYHPTLGCPYCGVPSPKPPSTPQPPAVPLPPVTVPPVTPVVPVPLPPVTPVIPVPLPPVVPVIPVPLPPVVPVLPVPLPPVPIVNPPTTPGPSGKPCPPGPVAQPKCPIDVLKLSACVDVLGGLVHGVIGYPVKTKCCSVIKGLADVDAALCLCTILKIKALNLKIYAPIALEVLLTCGKHIPPGFTCPF